MQLIRLAVAVVIGLCLFDANAQTSSTTNKLSKTTTENKATSQKAPHAGPFHAKLAAVDKTAKTITVGKRTFLITPETKLNKAGKPATLDDAVIGEPVSGYVKPSAEGKLIATKVNFGPKDEQAAKPAKKKKQS